MIFYVVFIVFMVFNMFFDFLLVFAVCLLRS